MSITITEIDVSDGVANSVKVTTDPTLMEHLPFAKNCNFPPCILPAKFRTIADRMQSFTVRADDVWTLAYPKTGSTWLQNIVWLLKNNLDYDTDGVVKLQKRSVLLERPMFLKENCTEEMRSYYSSSLNELDEQSSPRIIKSHLPMNLLPHQLWSIRPKIIYIARNPKDAAISMFHYIHNMKLFSGTLTEFLEDFLIHDYAYGPFHNHVLNFWQLRNLDNILFMTYEDILADSFTAIKKISEFLECKYSDEQLMGLTRHVSFEKMRENRAVNKEQFMNMFEENVGGKRPDQGFRCMRKGKAGGFQDEMSADMIKRFDDWTAEKLKDSDFKFAI